MTTGDARGGGVGAPHRRRSVGSLRSTDAMVTAELAVGLLAAIPLLLGLVGLTAVGVNAMQGQEAARVAARLLARGEPATSVESRVRSALPEAEVSIETREGMIHVQVAQRVAGYGLLPEFTITGRAATPVEGE